MRFEHQIDIGAPVERVWEVMADVERWPEWTASVSKVELLNVSTLAPGAKARIRQPRLPTTIWDVTAVSAPTGFTWVAKSPGGRSVADHRIEAAVGGSHVILSIEMSGPVGAVVSRLYGGLTRRYLQMEAEGLKRRSEAD